MDDLILEKHIGRIIPTNPKLSIDSYIKDYKIERVKNKDFFMIKMRKFLSDKWYNVTSFSTQHLYAAEYLKDPKKKESIIFTTNSLMERGYTPSKAFTLIIRDKLENIQNINRLLNI